MFNTNGKSWLDLKCAESKTLLIRVNRIKHFHFTSSLPSLSLCFFWVLFTTILVYSSQTFFVDVACMSKLKYNFNRYEHCTVSVNVVLKFLFDRKRKSSITKLVCRIFFISNFKIRKSWNEKMSMKRTYSILKNVDIPVYILLCFYIYLVPSDNDSNQLPYIFIWNIMHILLMA